MDWIKIIADLLVVYFCINVAVVALIVGNWGWRVYRQKREQ